MITFRDAEEGDFPAIVRLNKAEEQQTSPMDEARLAELHSLSAYHRVALDDDQPVGFLLTMADSADYENDNFAWFAARHPRFLYIDRIVIARTYSGRGIGTAFYQALFDYARAADYPLVACEYNIEPPNPASKKFHDRLGFRESGAQRVAQGSKLVSLQIARIAKD